MFLEKVISSYEQGLVGARAFVDLFEPEFELIDIHRATLQWNGEIYRHGVTYSPNWREQVKNPRILELLDGEFVPWDLEEIQEDRYYAQFGYWTSFIHRPQCDERLGPGWPEFIHPEGCVTAVPWLEAISDEIKERLSKLGFKKRDVIKFRQEVALRKDLRLVICPTPYQTMLIGLRKRVNRPKRTPVKYLAPLFF